MFSDMESALPKADAEAESTLQKEGGIEGDSVDKEGSRHECAPKGSMRVPGYVDPGLHIIPGY